MPALGEQEFYAIRKDDILYIDKTEMISRLADDKNKVLVFSRPRRFGKSLNLSMLDCYFNEKFKGNQLFDGLRISEIHPEDPLKNSMPVIMLDLKDMNVFSYEDFLKNLGRRIFDAASDFEWISQSESISEGLRKDLVEILGKDADASVLTDSIRVISEAVFKSTGKPSLVLVDEYDSAINNASDQKVRERINDFMRRFMSSAFKGNPYIWKGVITGVLALTQRTMFSSCNNIVSDDIASERYADMFGFTEEEIESLASYYRRPEMPKTVGEWYDGYIFGNTRIFCTWSVLSYIDRGFKPGRFWTATGSTQSILEMIKNRPESEIVNRILSGERILITLKRDITLWTQDPSDDDILSLMVMTGYLRAELSEDGECFVSIPNKEIRTSIATEFVNFLEKGDGDHLNNLCVALKAGHTEDVAKELQYVFMKYESVRIAGTEGAAQSYMLGIMTFMNGDYDIKEDSENGEGYPDIMMKSLRSKNPHIIIEVKRGDSGDSDEHMKSLSVAAVQQIKNRNYAFGLEGSIHMYGVAVRGKKVFVHSEKNVQADGILRPE